MSDIVKHVGDAVSHATMTSEQIDLIKRTVAKGTTDDEFSLFVYTAKRFGLDPLARQIHAVKRWDSDAGREVMAIQIGIDGFRLTADRTGCYAPGRETTYTYDTEGKVESATAYVKKLAAGEWHEVAETAYTEEYAGRKKDGTPTRMWNTLTRVMIAKCAEARALRRAFPAELSGVYEPSEMHQAGPQREEIRQPLPAIPKAAPVAVEQGNFVTGTVEQVTRKDSAPGSKKPWSKWGVLMGGEWYGTFDRNLGAAAEELMGSDARIEWKQDDKYKTLLSISSAGAAEAMERTDEDTQLDLMAAAQG